MATYMVKVFDSFENCYLSRYIAFYYSEDDAINAAIELTKKFVKYHCDFLEADVFIKGLGRGEYQLIGYVSYDCETWDDELIEFEQCFC